MLDKWSEKIRFKISIFQNSQCKHVTHIKQHLQVNTESLKSFSVSTEPEQRSPMTPIKGPTSLISVDVVPSPNWVGDIWLILWLSTSGLHTDYHSSNTLQLRRWLLWLYASYRLRTVFFFLFVCLFLLNMGHTWVFSWKSWNISSAKVLRFFIECLYTETRSVLFILFAEDEFSDCFSKAKPSCLVDPVLSAPLPAFNKHEWKQLFPIPCNPSQAWR